MVRTEVTKAEVYLDETINTKEPSGLNDVIFPGKPEIWDFYVNHCEF